MVKKLIVTLLMSGLNLLPFGIPVQAEVIQEYNEFSGETKVLATPKNWDGKTPILFLDDTFEGKKLNEIPYAMTFSVIAPLSEYMSCAKGVSGVIADGERVVTWYEREDFSDNKPRMMPMEMVNSELSQYIKLWGRYEPKDFMKIVNATEVKYQLCGKDVYTLSSEEQEILKEYTAIILNSDIWPED